MYNMFVDDDNKIETLCVSEAQSLENRGKNLKEEREMSRT